MKFCVREVHPFTKMKLKKFITLCLEGTEVLDKRGKLLGCIIHFAGGWDL